MFVEVFETKPQGFRAAAEVSAVYLEIDGLLLLLKSADWKEEAGKWGVPAGKVQRGETPKEAACRELFEETGIAVDGASMQSVGSLYIRKPHIQYVYHLFRIVLEKPPEVKLSKEHLQSFWASAQDLESLPLMAGAFEALSKYRAALAQKRSTASVNVYLILKQGDSVLLSLRQNTGYLDQHWGFPAGHVEPGESASAAMVREAREETGIEILSEDLKTVHIMHRKSNRLNVDIFFECAKWEGEIENREPHKCGGLKFFSPEALPFPIVESNAFVLQTGIRDQIYSEWGFS